MHSAHHSLRGVKYEALLHAEQVRHHDNRVAESKDTLVSRRGGKNG
jgi:hypothetical protein